MKLAFWVAGAIVVGLAAGVAWPPPAISRAQLTQDQTWALPSTEQVVRFSPKGMQTAMTGLHWAAESAETDLGSAGPWTLLGLASAEAPFALVSAGAKVQRLEVGQTLPDGSRLDAIERDRMTVIEGDCRRIYQLYRPKPIEQSGMCTDQNDSNP